MRTRKIFALPLVCFCLFVVPFTGCANRTGTTIAPIHAGAANAFDSGMYDALVTIQAGIEQAKVGVTASQKPLLNRIIADYNIAEKAYAAYHAAAASGSATPAQQQALQTQVDALRSSLSTLGGTK